MLKLVLSITLLLMLLFRAPVCFFFYPEMATDAGDWDGSNSLTMNVNGVLTILSVIISLLKTKYFIGEYFLVVAMLLCVSNILDRAMGIYEFTSVDKVFTIPACFILPSFYYLIKYVFQRKERT